MVMANRLRSTKYVQRTCDRCSVYVPEGEHMNTPPAIEYGDPKWVAFGWYDAGGDGKSVNHFCDKCFLSLKLEGKL